MSVPVVAIGYILLIPCILGILFGFLMLFATGSASSQISKKSEQEIRSTLVTANVPDGVADAIIKDGHVAAPERERLTDSQKRAVDTATMQITGRKIGTGAATAMAGGASIVIIVMSFVGGLLGWLLVMKKKVLQCTACETVIAAS